ncbi:hypothetical protein J437_LFUL005262 [Ladona fulva]|uniref:Reverse transcriptase domain-containing protein n=1 Tax=Ladona fulva TaxID=123851 RepID=A0A8K0JW44_LADFU|nr:hypothetical protein J437_LFUL005262 [Ladona fulva]
MVFHNDPTWLLSCSMVYQVISDIFDCKILQSNLNLLLKWCVNNKMKINVSKCNIITFSHIKNRITYGCYLEGVLISRPNFIRDLGVLFDSTFLGVLFNSTFLGVLNTKNFKDVRSLKTLCCSLVRPLLEFSSMYIKAIEKIQHRFLRVIHFRFNNQLINFSYDNILSFLNLSKLHDRRIISDLVTLYKIVHGIVNCPLLLFEIQFRIPSHFSRSGNTFYIDTYSTNYMHNSPLAHLQRLCNSIFCQYSIDIFHKNVSQIKH